MIHTLTIYPKSRDELREWLMAKVFSNASPHDLAAAVGSGDVTVTFSVATTDLQSAASSRQATKRMVDGKVMVGEYTIDGKKL